MVLDASAAVRAVLDSESALLAALEAADLVIAPDLIVAEVCSAFRKHARVRALSWPEAEKSVDRALCLVERTEPMSGLAAEVLALSARVENSIYDLFYLALAQRTGAVLLTADGALRRAAEGLGVEVEGAG